MIDRNILVKCLTEARCGLQDNFFRPLGCCWVSLFQEINCVKPEEDAMSISCVGRVLGGESEKWNLPERGR